jgi:TELO2-interacting protein 1
MHENLARCLRWLFNRYDPRSSTATTRLGRISLAIDQSDIAPTLGYAVYRMLELASASKAKPVALGYLLALQSVVDALADTRVLPSFLPGMLATFSRILNGDFKRGSSVFEACVNLLASIVVVALGDTRNPSVSKMENAETISAEEAVSRLRDFGEKQTQHTESDPVEALFPSAAWFSKAADRIVPLLQRLFRIANRGSSLDEFESAPISAASIAFESPRVRIAVSRAAHVICLSCCFTLRDLIPLLLDVLVTLRQDPFPEVSVASEAAIQDLGAQLSRGFAFQELLQRNLERLLASLPRVIRLSDDAAKQMRLRALLGYLLLQRNSLSVSLPGLLPRLSEALIDGLEINLRDPWISRPTQSALVEGSISLASTAAGPIGEGISFASFHFRRQFLHFQDKSILDLMLQILHLLGAYGDCMQLVDHFLAVFRGEAVTLEDQSRRHPPQAILIVNEIVLGAKAFPSASCEPELIAAPNPDIADVVDYLLVHYLSTDFWNEDYMSAASSLVSQKFSEHRAVVSSLLIEGIGVFVYTMGPSVRFKLMDILYPLLEKLGDETEMVSTAAWASLLRTAFICGYSSVLELIQENSDYIVDSIVQNLRYLKKYGPSIQVLRGLLRHSGELIVPILGDILDEIFRCLDERDRNFSGGFLRVMAAATELVKSKVLSQLSAQTDHAPNPPSFQPFDLDTNRRVIEDENLSLNAFLAAKLRDRRDHLDRLRALRTEKSPTSAEEFFNRYHEEKEQNSGLDMHPPAAEIVSQDFPADDPSARRPGESESKYYVRTSMAKELKVIERVLEKCQHFTSIAGVDNRILVLEMISSAISTLGCDPNVLLPLVHQLWDPLSHRFTDEDQRVANAGLQLMQVLAEHCGEFVSKRFSDELWPKIKLRLKRFNVFLRSTSGTDEATQYSSAYRRAPDLFKFSSSYKSQRASLDCLYSACRHLSLPRSIAQDILSTIWFYFSPIDHPKDFVSLATKIIQEVKLRHGDMVWRMSADLGRVAVVAPAATLQNFDSSSRKLRMQLDRRSLDREGASDLIAHPPTVEACIGPFCRFFVGAPDGLVRYA